MKSSSRFSSGGLDSDKSEKPKTRGVPSSGLAVSESHTIAATCLSPRRQLACEASRSTRHSEGKPAATNMVRAVFKNAGQVEATPTNAVEGAGKWAASDAPGERKSSVTRSAGSGRAPGPRLSLNQNGTRH